jgi:hypothetical protein
MFRRTIARVLVASMTLSGLLVVSAPAAQATHTSTKARLTLVHGIDGPSGFPVDISVYRLAVGSQRFTGVTYGTVAGPLELSSGLYWVGIRPAGASRYSTPILSKWVWLSPGDNRSAVAHLSAAGSPRLSVYHNDVSDSGPGKARVTVRHNAAVGPVDVFANGTKVISSLANPYQAKRNVPATTIQIRVALAGGGATVLNAPVAFAENTNTIVYATLTRDGAFNPLIQVIPTH